MPDWRAYVRRRLDLPALNSERESDIIEDIARQLADSYEEALADGASEEDARTQAERHIPDWPALAQQLATLRRDQRSRVERLSHYLDDRAIRSQGSLGRFGGIRQDLVYGFRLIRRAPGSSSVAVLSLALGVGATTAIFNIMHALMFRPVPVVRPAELVSLTDPQAAGLVSGVSTGERQLLSYHEFEGLRDGGRDVLAGIVAFSSSDSTVPALFERETEERTVHARLVNGEYFSTLGVLPDLGVTFGSEVDLGRVAHPVVVLSHRFWRQQLASDPTVVGRTIRIRRTTFTVAGVMRPEFTGLVVGSPPDLWLPLTMQEALTPGEDWLMQPPETARRVMFLQVLGRLSRGISLERANTVLNARYQAGLQADAAVIPDSGRAREVVDSFIVVRSASYGVSWLRAEYSQPLTVLMMVVGLLLLLACANVANLLLARATRRRREMAMRVALGAGRVRLLRQLLTESVLLGMIGTAAGLCVAYGGTRLLLWLASGTGTAIDLDAPLDRTVLAFTGALAMLTSLLFGLAPAVGAMRISPAIALRSSAARLAGQSDRMARWSSGPVLATVQMSISLTLLVTAALFVASLQRLGSVPLGYEAEHLVQFRLRPTVEGYHQSAIEPLFETLLARIATVPGVAGVTLSSNGLFYGTDFASNISLPGALMPEGVDMDVRFDLIGPRYFSTLGIPVVAGHDIRRDDAVAVQGCWLNQTAASHFFPNNDPLGRRVVAHFSYGDFEYEIRGVVADSHSHSRSLRTAMAPRVYLPYFNSAIPIESAVFEVRTASEGSSVMSGLRHAVGDASRLPPPTFRTVPELLDLSLRRDHVTAQLSTLFGVLALALSTAGLYGVLSYGVSRRVVEIGVRLAIGATPAGIVYLVLKDGLRVVAAGCIVGLAGAFALTRFISSMLYGSSMSDAAVFAAATGLLVGVAVLAAMVPAWRASRIDPLIALRSE